MLWAENNAAYRARAELRAGLANFSQKYH